MTFVPRLVLFPRPLQRNALAWRRWTAIGVFCAVAFVNANARGQDLFIYRDVETGISSNVTQSLSLRFMRHIWTTSDSAAVMVAIAQKGGFDGQGLALYKSLNNGGDWEFERVLSSDNIIISDGVLDPDNNLLVVTSRIGSSPTTGVNFIKLIYDSASHTWSFDPGTPVAVVVAAVSDMPTRATISLDSNGVIWCAYRSEFTFLGIPGFAQIKVSYSADGGYTWSDSGNRFGTFNRHAEKSGKVLAVGSQTVLIYQDLQGASPNTARYKSWGYREDSAPLQSAWTNEPISLMVAAQDDTVGSHWSVAADEAGNVHLSYQDAGIRYLKYDATTDTWQNPVVITTADGSYNSISVAANDDLYLFCRFSTSPKVFCRQYSAANQRWGRWLTMSAVPHLGYLRMSSPERFTDHLPMLYESGARNPYNILYVLLDTVALNACP